MPGGRHGGRGDDCRGLGPGRAAIGNVVTSAISTLGGTNSRGIGINDSGQVAGYSYLAGDDFGITHAFVYNDGVMTDLNVVIGSAGWLLTETSGINDSGQIVGYGYQGDMIGPQYTKHAFRLDPISPPDVGWTLLLLGMSLAGLGTVPRLRK